jgi:hypothetical protein
MSDNFTAVLAGIMLFIVVYASVLTIVQYYSLA